MKVQFQGKKMSKLSYASALIAGLLLATPASAESVNIRLQPFAAVQTFDFVAGSTTVDSTLVGGGMRLEIPTWSWLELTGSAQFMSGNQDTRTTAGRSDSDLDELELRGGLKFKLPLTQEIRLTGTPELIWVQDDNGSTTDDSTGFAIRFGLEVGDPMGLIAYADGGFLAFDDDGSTSGLEFKAGLRAALGRHFGLFSEYRIQNLEDDFGTDIDGGLFRIGLMLQF